MSWIDLSAIGKIVVFGLVAGAGLPALFSVGLVALGRGPRARTATASEAVSGSPPGQGVLVGGSPAGIAVAAVCFLIVLAAIGWGIFQIYQAGHPHK